MPLLVDPIQTDLVYVQESEGVLSLGEGIVLLAFLLVELWVFLFFFLVPSCAKQASLSFLAQVSEDKPLSFIRIRLSGDLSNNLFW
jgi:hypothetical protein